MNDFLRWLDQGRGNQSNPSRNNLSYANPKFGKRKKSDDGGQFDWQGKLLKDLPKTMGSTYEKKFDTLASQIGVPKEQMSAFKTFIDAQEYGAKTHSQHIRDYDINQAKRDGAGARTILREREQREKQSELERLAQVAKQQATQKRVQSWGGLPGMNVGTQGATRNRGGQTSSSKFFEDIKKAFTGENHRIEPTKDSKLHFGDSDSRTTLRPPENVERFGGRAINSALLGLPEQDLVKRLKANPNDEKLMSEYERVYGGEGKWTDFVADILGYLPPGLAGVKAARAAGVGAKGLTKGVSKHNLKELAKEGAVVGGAMGLGEVTAREVLNPEDYSALDNLAHVGINMAAGAVLDPALGLALPAFKHLSQKAMKDMIGPQSDILSQMVRNEVKASGLDIGTLDPSFNTGGRPNPKSEDILRGLTSPETGIGRVNANFPEANIPTAPRTATVGGASKRLDPGSSVDDVLAYARDKANPIREEDIPVIHREFQNIETRINDLKNSKSPERAEMMKLLETSDPNFKTSVEGYKEISDQLGNAIGRLDEWGEIKNLKKMFSTKNAPEQYKFHIPDSDKLTYRDVPQRFRTSDYNAPHIDNAADIAGYGTIDEFIDHLVTLNRSLTTQRKDLDLPTAKEFRAMESRYDELKSNIEKSVDEALGVTQLEQQMDELAEYMIPRSGETHARTSTVDRSTLERVLGMSDEPKRPGYDDIWSDEQVEAMIRGRQPQAQAQSAATLADEHFPDLPQAKSVVDLDKVKPIAYPVKPKESVRSKTAGALTNLRKHVDSDLFEAEKIEQILAKNLTDDMKHMVAPSKRAGLDEAFSFHKGSRMLRSAHARGLQSAESTYRPIVERVNKAGVSYEQFDEYLLARHVDDIYKNNMDLVARRVEALDELESLADPNSAKGITLQREIKELEPYQLNEEVSEEWVAHTLAKYENNPTVQKAQQDFIAEQQKDLDMLEREGVLSKESVERMKERHPNYVSMMRDIEDSVERGIGTGRGLARNPVKARGTGSEDKSLSPLGSAYRNRVLSTVNSERAATVNKISKLLEIDGADQFFRRVSEKDPKFDPLNVIHGYENGQKVFYEVPQSILEAFKNLDAGQMEFYGSNLVKGLATLRKQTTTNLNIPFHLMSSVRDSYNAIINSNTNAHIGHTVLGFLDSFMGEGLEKATGGMFKSYKAAYKQMGSEMGTFQSMDKYTMSKVAEALEKGKLPQGFSLLDPIRKFGMATEHGPRLGEFRSAKGKGFSDRGAAYESMNIIDYSDMGQTVRKANPYTPYLNPTIRGNIRTLQALKRNPVEFVAKGSMYLALPTYLNYQLRFADTTTDVQRDKIRNQPGWIQNTMWSIPDPREGSDTIFLIPKPFILGQMFANPIERVLDKVHGETHKDTKALLKDTGADIFTTLAFPYDVAGIMTGIEAMANYDFFTGMPIEDRGMENEEPKDRHNVYTSEAAKALGQLTGLSPAKIDHVLKKSTGTMGRDAFNIADNLLSEVNEDMPAKPISNEQILNPLKRFVRNDTVASGVYEDIFKESKKDDRKHKDELEWLKGMGIKSTTKMETEAQKTNKAYLEINKQIKEVRENKTLTAKEKQKQITRLRNDQNKLGTKYIGK